MENKQFEERQKPREDVLLRFTLDGIFYALRQNQLSKEQLESQVMKWFPEADIIKPPEETTMRLFEEDGA